MLFKIVLILFLLSVNAYGADVKISNLPLATAVNGTDEIPTNQSGTTRKITVNQILDSTVDTINFSSIDANSITATNVLSPWVFNKTLSADADDTCDSGVDCIAIPTPVVHKKCEVWYSTYYIAVIVAADGTATVLIDSDAAGTGIEYHSSIASCEGLCLYDGGTTLNVFNDTAASVTVSIVCWGY